MDVVGLKEWLRLESQALGFARVGFASCKPFKSEAERVARWLEQPGADFFPYLQASSLLDPAEVMEGARTAMVGFFPYARPDAVPGEAPGSLRVSRYLWGRDYHMTLKGRLSRLATAAQERWPDLKTRVCVDTAPLMERQMAVRAGLGWQGRNTLLIAGKAGSWGFLGVLLLNAELEPDPPFVGHHCGHCRACIDACPSGALTAFKLDPGRCLTTYTVETEAEPPEPVALGICSSGWVAGCDACQEACPWNRAPLWGDPALWGGPSPIHTLPAESMALNTAQYRKLTRQSALRRVRHRHWLANVARAAGTPR